MYTITFKKKAEKELRKIPVNMLTKVAAAIDELAEEPRPNGSKKLKGSEEELWRIRIGVYRVIYHIEDEIRIVNVRKVGHRKDIYRG